MSIPIHRSVSIVLTVLNEADNIRVLLEALLAQTRRADEIVIVDGGSTDRTRDVVVEFRSRHKEIVLIVEPDVNIAEGRNVAIRAARYDILAVTDGGCRPTPEWLAELVAPLEQDPTMAAVAGRIVIDSHSEFEECSGLLSTPKFNEPGGQQRGMFYGRCSAFTRKLWESVGGYPEWLYTAEDSLFALAAKHRSFKACYTPDALLHWRPRPNLRKTARMFFLYGRGNGRIHWGSVSGSWYWLRYYCLFVFSLIIGFKFHYVWLASAAIGAFIAFQLFWPNRQLFAKVNSARARFYYLPMILLARNLYSNLGYVFGHLEYLVDPLFKRKLLRFLGSETNTDPYSLYGANQSED